MALNIKKKYGANRVNPASDKYPFSSAKNADSKNDNNATPFEASWVNDILGFQQSLLKASGQSPNGAPDNVMMSQYLGAIFNLRWYPHVGYEKGTKVTASDGSGYICDITHEPANHSDPYLEISKQKPMADRKWLSEASYFFGMLHPIGCIWMSLGSSSPKELYGVGIWEAIEGRFIAGSKSDDEDFEASKEGGATSPTVVGHRLTVREMPGHQHDFKFKRTREAKKDHKYDDAYVHRNDAVVLDISDRTEFAGGGEEHTHSLPGKGLPPYIVANIWKRTG